MNRYSVMVPLQASLSLAAFTAPALAQDRGINDGIEEIEEVVITAQRREESVQKAAIAISVVSPEALANAGITNPVELTKIVPALQITPAAGTSAIFNIRGIANFAVNPWSDAAVLFNYDGVPITRSSGINGLFYDLERVEVLKGPQGTLYGRNATGGAINVLPHRPEPGKFSGDLGVEFGNYNLKHVTGAVNVPVADKAALRASFDITDRDGYYSSGTGDNVGQAGRLQFLVEPTDALSIVLGGDYYHQGGKGSGSTLIHGQFIPGTSVPDPQMGEFVASDPWTDINDLCAVKAAYFSNDPSVCLKSARVDSTFWGINATVDYDLGFGTLTVIPAYRKQRIHYDGHNNPTFHQRLAEEQTSVEARVTSNDTGSPLKWVVGGFWIDNPNNGDFGTSLRPAETTALGSVTDNETTSWATFAQGTYSIRPRVRVTAGARYTHDQKIFRASTIDNNGSITGFPGTTISSQDRKKNWDAVTGKAGLEFDVAEDSLLYLNYDRGYHSGGFFITGFPEDSYKPEQVQAYAIGSKNLFFDRRLQVNVEGFHYRYTDQQISHLVIAVFGGIPSAAFVTENVGKSDISGVELDVAYKLTPNTLITADVQWLHARYKEFIYSSGVAPSTSGCTALAPTPTGLPGFFAFSFSYDCSGKPMVNSPTWKSAIGIQQTFPLANGGSIVGEVHAYVQSGAWLSSYDYLPFDRDGSNGSGDLSLSYHAPQERWSLAAFVNNVTNEANRAIVYGNGDTENLITQANGSPPSATLKPPRTYGIRMAVHF